MTSIPPATETSWILKISASAAPANSGHFDQQVQLLRSVAAYDTETSTWHTYIGTLDTRALETLQRLYEGASKFGTTVTLQPVVPPSTWRGPTFHDAGELAAVAAAGAEQGRRLGELPKCIDPQRCSRG
ncbi:hypothetical protein [Streptomyces lydicus]|uniref:hypothetical protein n=1 Tax=Streptomyces lydicus TaxID=47763 RepID=UPI0036EA33C6